MFWLAWTYHNPLYAYAEHEEIARRSAGAGHLIWYTAGPSARAARKRLDECFDGPVQVATFRSAWNNPDALFVGLKAGYNQVNHGHLDLGNFELDALGVRWVRDLGADNYNLPGYWSSGRGGKRWSYYRLNSASHNICMLGGESQDPMAKSTFVLRKLNGANPAAIVDLTDAYEKFVNAASRGVAMIQGRRAVLVQDEFDIKVPCEVAWGMTTDAQIDIAEASRAVLTLKGQELSVRVLSPEGATFTVESAEQAPPQKANKGVKRLVVRKPRGSGAVRVSVLFSPVWQDGNVVQRAEVIPLKSW